ncbi:MAG: DUF4358 domain-containing protein [Oscillospiraceae bacterium]
MNILKKVISSIICTGIILAGFAGCGGEKKTTDIDLLTLSSKLQSELTFKDTLNQLDNDMIATYYPKVDVAKLNESVVFISGTGSTAEEIALFEVKNTADAETVKNAVQERITDQTISFEDYNANEMVKINNAVVKTSGNYVFLVMCDDYDSAGKILSEQIK